MAFIHDITQVRVGVYDEVREFYKVNKYLGGLIKTFQTVHSEKLGRTVTVLIPALIEEDTVLINGIEWRPKPTPTTSNKEKP